MYFPAIMKSEKIGQVPYTKKSIDYVLSSTKNDLNTWVTVKANVKEDFMELHGIEVLRYIRSCNND